MSEENTNPENEDPKDKNPYGDFGDDSDEKSEMILEGNVYAISASQIDEEIYSILEKQTAILLTHGELIKQLTKSLSGDSKIENLEFSKSLAELMSLYVRTSERISDRYDKLIGNLDEKKSDFSGLNSESIE